MTPRRSPKEAQQKRIRKNPSLECACITGRLSPFKVITITGLCSTRKVVCFLETAGSNTSRMES
jgi:hypothetical protein